MKTNTSAPYLLTGFLLLCVRLWGQVASPHNFPHADARYREMYPYGPQALFQAASMGMNGYVAITTTDNNAACRHILLDSVFRPVMNWQPTGYYSFTSYSVVNKDRRVWTASSKWDTLHLASFSLTGSLAAQRRIEGYFLNGMVTDTSGHVYLSYTSSSGPGFGIMRFTNSMTPDYQKWYPIPTGGASIVQWGIDQRLYLRSQTAIYVVAADGTLLKVIQNINQNFTALQDHSLALISIASDSLRITRLDSSGNLLWCKKIRPNYPGSPSYTIPKADISALPGTHDLVVVATLTNSTPNNCNSASQSQTTPICIMGADGSFKGRYISFIYRNHTAVQPTPFGDPLIIGSESSCLTSATVWDTECRVLAAYDMAAACTGTPLLSAPNAVPGPVATLGTGTSSSSAIPLLTEAPAFTFSSPFPGLAWYTCVKPCLNVTQQDLGGGLVQFQDDIFGFYNFQYAFGDGTFGSANDPLHQYPGPGNYPVQVIATNGCGSDTFSVTFNPCLTPGIAGPTSACGLAPVTFTETNGLPANTLSWLVNGVPSGSGSILNWTPPTTGIHQIGIIYTAGLCTDTIYHTYINNVGQPFSLGPDATFCPDTTWQLTGPSGMASYAWNTSAITPSISPTVGGTYSLLATDNTGCIASDTIVLTLSNDCVWPGDANHDGVADNQDLLAIAYALNNTGPARPAASPSWYGQLCPNWLTALPSFVNHKHADCNGSGQVTAADTTLIIAHYGLTHNKGNGITTGIPLTLVPEQDSFPAGDTVYFNVVLGDAFTPAADAHGVAFGFHIDPQQITPGSLNGRYPNSFLTNGGQPLTLTYQEVGTGNWHLAVSRTDHVGQSGAGAIMRVGFLPAQVYPLTSTLGYVPLRMLNPTGVDANFAPLLLAGDADSILIYSNSIGVDHPLGLATWHIHPVPTASDAILEITLAATEEVEANLVDMQGRTLRSLYARAHLDMGSHQLRIPTDGLANGIYFVELWVDGRRMVKKLVLER